MTTPSFTKLFPEGRVPHLPASHLSCRVCLPGAGLDSTVSSIPSTITRKPAARQKLAQRVTAGYSFQESPQHRRPGTSGLHECSTLLVTEVPLR